LVRVPLRGTCWNPEPPGRRCGSLTLTRCPDRTHQRCRQDLLVLVDRVVARADSWYSFLRTSSREPSVWMTTVPGNALEGHGLPTPPVPARSVRLGGRCRLLLHRLVPVQQQDDSVCSPGRACACRHRFPPVEVRGCCPAGGPGFHGEWTGAIRPACRTAVRADPTLPVSCV